MRHWMARSLAVCLASSLVAVPVASGRAALHAPAEEGASADERAPAAVVGLDSDDLVLGARLTGALRKAFARQGLSGGEEAELSELRLALDCTADEPACLAAGGEMLGARRLIYGRLQRADGDRWTVDLSIVETESTTLAEHQTFTIEGKRLSPSAVDELATELVRKMLPDAEETTVPAAASGGAPPPPPPPKTDGSAADSSDPSEGKKLWFGLERPTPRWKSIGLGVSGGLFVVGLASTVVMSAWLTADNWGFRRKLLDEAQASLEDDKELNDVDPNLPVGINLCDFARTPPTDPETGEVLGTEGEVRNARITKICDDGDLVRRIQVGTAIGTAVAGVSTLVFSGLLLIHKGPRPGSRRTQAWRRHRLTLGVGGAAGRGATLRLRGRF